MSDSLWPVRLALAGAIALAGGSCVLGDLFGPDGLEEVALRLRPQNISVDSGQIEDFTVDLEAGGTPVRNAQVTLTISDSSLVTFFGGGSRLVRAAPVQDSLKGLAPGCATLVARFESSMLGYTAITESWGIRIRVGTGGGGPCP